METSQQLTPSENYVKFKSTMYYYPYDTPSYVLDCSGMEELPPLPPKLRNLTLRNATKVQTLQSIPQGLQSLYIEDGYVLPTTVYATLPESLIELGLDGVPTMDVRVLPQWITRLSLGRTQITEFPEGVFPNLKRIVLYQEDCIHKLHIPPKVTYIQITSLASLTSIDAFPSLATEIQLWDLPNLQEIPEFPTTLSKLNIDSVPVTLIPPLPEKDLYVSIIYTRLPAHLAPENRFGIGYTGWISRVNPLLKELWEKNRTQKRCRLVQEELKLTAHSPERVAKWLGDGDWDLLDRMLGIA